MPAPTLGQVKINMNLEGINDFDDLLTLFLEAAVVEAENITGRNISNPTGEEYEVNPALNMAILRRVAAMFDSRQDNDEAGQKEAVNASIYTFRQLSKRPMF